MSLAVNLVSAGVHNTNSDASSYTHASAYTPTANTPQVVFVCAAGTLAAAPTLSGGSITWTLQPDATFNSGVSKVYCFTGISSGSPGSCTLVFDCTGDAATGCIIAPFEVIDAATSGYVVQVKAKNSTTGSNPTVTADANLNTLNAYLMAVACAANPAGLSVPSGWSEPVDVGHTSPTTGLWVGTRVGGESGATITATRSSINYGAILIEIKVGNIAKSGTETPTVAITETKSLDKSSSRTETPTVSISDVSTNLLSSDRTDIPTVGITDTSGVVVVNDRTETPSVEISDVSTNLLSSDRTETPTVAISETSTNLLSSARTETPTVAISESAEIIVSVNRSDILEISAGEVASPLVTVSTSDAVSVSAPETSGNALSLQRTETPTVSISESSTNLLALSRADTLSVAIGDVSGNDAPIPIDVSDTASAGISDAGTVPAIAFGVSDSITAAISEATNLLSLLSRIDSLAVSTGEARSLAATSSRSDSATLGIDAVSTISTLANPSDAVSVGIEETASIVVLLARGDSVSLSIGDAKSIAATLSRAETIGVSLSDSAGIFRPVGATEEISVSVSDATTIEDLDIGEEVSRADTAGVRISESYQLKISGPVKWSGRQSIAEGDRSSRVDAVPRVLSPEVSDRENSVSSAGRVLDVGSREDFSTLAGRRERSDSASLQISDAASVTVV